MNIQLNRFKETLYQQINKILNKRKTIGEFIGVFLLFLSLCFLTIIIYFIYRDTYVYTCFDNTIGTSNTCYKKDGKLYCRVDLEVKEFSEK